MLFLSSGQQIATIFMLFKAWWWNLKFYHVFKTITSIVSCLKLQEPIQVLKMFLKKAAQNFSNRCYSLTDCFCFFCDWILAPENCKRRTLDGRCCVLPFVYNGVLHNDCITTNDDIKGPWCAVSLNSAVNEGNHKWRAKCRSK